jgi:23S rRNA (cytosine1962-C5)-methyltransferase
MTPPPTDQPEPITGRVQLQHGREKPVLQHHPWVFSGAIQHLHGQPAPGDLVSIQSAHGRDLALAYYNPRSQIQARILTWNPQTPIDRHFWRQKIEAALALRQALALEPATNAYRLINAEADGLPGLVVDKYGDYLVLQCLTLGIDKRRELLVSLLAELCQPKGILERSDATVRRKEGLPTKVGVVWGDVPTGRVAVLEHGRVFLVNLHEGQKTGFYLDQRENRALLALPHYVQGREILNVFAYTGGFAAYAASGGAGKIINVDSSASALALAEENVTAVAGSRPQDEYIVADAFALLRQYRDAGRQFDVVILDPPKFVNSQRDLNQATRGYKDINWLGLRLLRPGGLLVTFSCSGLLSADLFQKILFGAAVDANTDVHILHHLWQAPDHTISLTVPESAYLKGFLGRVTPAT